MHMYKNKQDGIDFDGFNNLNFAKQILTPICFDYEL